METSHSGEFADEFWVGDFPVAAAQGTETTCSPGNGTEQFSVSLSSKIGRDLEGCWCVFLTPPCLIS